MHHRQKDMIWSEVLIKSVHKLTGWVQLEKPQCRVTQFTQTTSECVPKDLNVTTMLPWLPRVLWITFSRQTRKVYVMCFFFVVFF